LDGLHIIITKNAYACLFTKTEFIAVQLQFIGTVQRQ